MCMRVVCVCVCVCVCACVCELYYIYTSHRIEPLSCHNKPQSDRYLTVFGSEIGVSNRHGNCGCDEKYHRHQQQNLKGKK